MSDEQVATGRLRAGGQYGRRRLVLSWKPTGNTTPEDPEHLVSMVEVGIFARAVEIVETAAVMPDGLDGETALGWEAGAAATVTALRRALEHQAGLLPPSSPARPRRVPPPPRPPRVPGEELTMVWRVGAIDWSKG